MTANTYNRKKERKLKFTITFLVRFYRKIGISNEYQYSEILQKEEEELNSDEEKEEEEEKWEEEETEKEARKRIKEHVEREFENLEFAPPRRGMDKSRRKRVSEEEGSRCTCSRSEMEEKRVEFEKVDFAGIGAKLRALSLSMSHLPQKKEEKRGTIPLITCI
jgi:hypothetical protein